MSVHVAIVTYLKMFSIKYLIQRRKAKNKMQSLCKRHFIERTSSQTSVSLNSSVTFKNKA